MTKHSDDNWTFDAVGTPVPQEFSTVKRYLDRAVFAFNNCQPNTTPPVLRSHLTAFCAHACRSLQESLEALVEGRKKLCREIEDNDWKELQDQIKSLPFCDLIKDVREHDIHGHPLPVCDPDHFATSVTVRRDAPLQLVSSEGVSVQLTFDGPKPVVHTSDVSKAYLKPGHAISYSCISGDLVVYDHRTDTNYRVIGVLREFLQAGEMAVTTAALVLGVALKPDEPEPDSQEGENDA